MHFTGHILTIYTKFAFDFVAIMHILVVEKQVFNMGIKDFLYTNTHFRPESYFPGRQNTKIEKYWDEEREKNRNTFSRIQHLSYG